MTLRTIFNDVLDVNLLWVVGGLLGGIVVGYALVAVIWFLDCCQRGIGNLVANLWKRLPAYMVVRRTFPWRKVP